MERTKILRFVQSQLHGVISTLSADGKLESAVIAYAETDSLELIFGTFTDSRKFKNLEHNSNIAFVIWSEGITVQYEGVVRMVEGKEEEEVRNTLLKKNPSSKKFVFNEKQRHFKVTPTWIRYSDFTVNPEEVFEVTF